MVVFLLALWFASYKIKGKRNFERCTDTKPDLPEKCRYLRMTLLISYRTFQYLSYLFGHPSETWAFSKLHEGLEYYFPGNFRWNLTYYEIETFYNFSLYHIFDSKNVRFPFFYEKFPDSRHREIENSCQYMLLRTDILHITVVKCPWVISLANI